MKKIALLSIIAAFAISCNKKEDAASRIGTGETTTQTTTDVATPEQNTNTNTTNAVTTMAFDKTTHDFGDLKKGSRGEYEFTITNTGENDLVILETKATCGCTVPEKPEAPIKPGESAKMKVAFSASSVGMQSKNVTVTANTAEGSQILTIKANVIE